MKDQKPQNNTPGKKQLVTEMFNGIASRYDFLNHLLSMGIDKGWRKKLVKMAGDNKPNRILDIACGTGDLSIALAAIKPKTITGLDIAVNMLEIGKEKVNRIGLSGLISFVHGDSEKLPFSNGSFNLTTAAFGVRNFENLDKGLSEMNRVLSPGGRVLILEFSRVDRIPWKWLFNFYFRFILPTIGRIVSGHNAAYTYLPESVGQFPSGQDFLKHLEKAGFEKTTLTPLTGGVATIYSGFKK